MSELRELNEFNNDAYSRLFIIENSLRCYIIKTLSKDPKWWFDFKQRDFFRICEEIKQQNNNEYSEIHNYDPQKSINKIIRYSSLLSILNDVYNS